MAAWLLLVKQNLRPGQKILFKKQLYDLEVKGHGPTKVIMVCDTPPYGHAPLDGPLPKMCLVVPPSDQDGCMAVVSLT
jgi:hypothetical protein